MRLTLKELAGFLKVPFQGADIELSGISIDSRGIQKGELFVALKGENLDGHAFISEVTDRGAAALLISQPTDTHLPFILVPDTLLALGQLGCLFRERYQGPVIAITGSTGKTSVKEMTAHILRGQGSVLANKGNFNNEVGLPLTLFDLNENHDFAVLELGARQAGDLTYLGCIAKPQVAIVNNVGPAHVEIFGSEEGTAAAKGEIYHQLASDGVAVINLDDKYAASFKITAANKRILSFSLTNKAADLSVKNLQLEAFGSRFILVMEQGEAWVHLKIPGEHAVYNALAASALVRALNLPLELIVQGLDSFAGVERRLQRRQGLKGALIFDDTYNANPASFKAAVDVLSHQLGPKILVVGDMLELGVDAEMYHRQLGEYAHHKNINSLLAVGKLAQHAAIAFGAQGQHFDNKMDLINRLKNILSADTSVVVKGSKAMRMWEVVAGVELMEE